MSNCRFLVINGVISQTSKVPQVHYFLETHSGAYTTTRTHNNGTCVLFLERHLHRLAESARILAESRPDFLFGSSENSRVLSSSYSSSLWWESVIRPLVNDSLRKVFPISLKEESGGEELVITTLVSGNSRNVERKDEDEDDRVEGKVLRDIDVFMHISVYIPPVFGVRENGAHLAVVGHGRDVARAKFSQWVRIRKNLEKLRPPLATELLLSDDGDQILEGSVTNFFVVCLKDSSDTLKERHFDLKCECPYEVQTAPLADGVLPGIIRQLVIEVCFSRDIPFREVAPQWSKRDLWQEAFITSSLRLVQHVETIRVPSSWELLELKTWKEVNWEETCFKEGPGILTSEIQREIMKRADLEGCQVSDFA
ncbi:D-aminoacid aminotransferase-like plp-dependent enzymes superfamily protein [Thalictrum thalictroides]|uniref:D-aminoacid aminotransferase-like plp-dependent enzymes superfamily protein n=1 Tax=Thalictrum thalictroides TaxID=46969 RepID=A0A7J6WLS8_THATH|nr:D-aminoacid aminotransferase-like plp-dependent enzymes superfamily protein [Thalictrum thalictroides]